MSEFVCFVVEGQTHYIEASKCLSMTLQTEKKGLVYTATMPKWLTMEAFSVFQQFLNNQLDIQRKYTDQTLQRLLWLGDHLQMEFFQETVIRDLILDRVSVQNCILFLNEAFKKLKACEDSQEVWYQMLNVCMNFTARNLLLIYQSNPIDLNKINQKVIEEILERALKHYRKKNNPELLQIVQKIRNCQDIVQIITQQKQTVLAKKINYQTHPSINWKLSNLSSIINKETQQFKFSDFTWKLVAKMEDKVLKIYLKLEDIDPELNLRIIALYFQLQLSQFGLEPLKLVNLVASKGNKILLCEFNDLNKFDQQKLEFTVYLNTDQVLTLCLNHLYYNLNPTYNLSKLDLDDCLILLAATPQVQQAQEKSFQLLLEFVPQLNPNDYERCINQLNLSLMNTEFLMKYVKCPLNQFIQYELDKRQPQQQRSYSVSKDSKSSSRILRQVSAGGSKNDKSGDQLVNRSQSSEKLHNEMPINKLQQLKKTPSQQRFEQQQIVNSGISNQSALYSRKQLFDEINIVNFLKVKDPQLIQELNELIRIYY
ncbi:unnamed protein product (macronuclear) [Paramecium tetraurelia]|uniref:Uncharacterized protein n=1 Tax=Paramecium tetraurelia TaxID=5888 RepID=A0DTS2_PARTE|nr:uncharacterized protein GSPATT00020121001 [Paramecium tetraurelia]CAK86439.1 unnamed protein product [Paramecium tetraurelia]|eukprot:XP_001453836.1 hypothetical protein (macronuclear) [Paramecium tetraurelia strain d4-2]